MMTSFMLLTGYTVVEGSGEGVHFFKTEEILKVMAGQTLDFITDL